LEHVVVILRVREPVAVALWHAVVASRREASLFLVEA
jgi:hypothetical protein